MGYFPVRYDSRVVIYERKMFIRLATEWPNIEATISHCPGAKRSLATHPPSNSRVTVVVAVGNDNDVSLGPSFRIENIFVENWKILFWLPDQI